MPMKYKTSIMWKIYTVWVFRTLINKITAKLAVIALLIWQLAGYVSFADVVRNVSSSSRDLSGYYAFFKSAVVNTEFITQMLLLGVIVVGVLFIWDFLHTDAREHSMQ